MTWQPWARLGGVELANAERTLCYLAQGLGGSEAASAVRFTSPLVIPAHLEDPRNLACHCAALGDGPYAGPAEDPAPWYDAGVPESEEFLGIILSKVSVGEILRRAVSARDEGATIGRLRLAHRVIGFDGIMFASSDRGMQYGQRWVVDVLAGEVSGCAVGDLELLGACDEGGFRTLLDAGVASDVSFPVVAEGLPDCLMRGVGFEIAAGVGYLLGGEETCLAEVTVSGSEECTFVGPTVGDDAAIIRIEADSLLSSGTFIAEPAAGYVDVYEDAYGPLGSSYAEFEIESLPAGSALVIDSVRRTVYVVEQDTGQVIGGLEGLSYRGLWRYVTASKGASERVYFEGSGFRAQVTTRLRER